MTPADFSPISSQARIAPGTRLNGIYEVDVLIASGGMGEVYKGHTIHTGDLVAIKMLRPEFGENEAALALFRKEASALHNLNHEAIVRYYVCSVDPELHRPYLAMEFVGGRSLSQLLQQGPLTFEAVRKLGQRIATGLHAAHECGIVHRDVAPDNVIIPGGDVGHAKIIDFGIARFTQSSDATIIGDGFAGKYKYVSPEQIGLFGGEVTAKSDIYSLGLVLVEALTGHPVDMGSSQLQVVEKRRKVPDLGGIDMRIRPLLEKMLQPDPADRPASMNTVVAMMTASSVSTELGFDARHKPAEPSQPKARKRWLVVSLLCIVVLAAGSGTAYYFLQPVAMPQAPPPPPLKAGADGKADNVAIATPTMSPTPSLNSHTDVAVTPPADMRPAVPSAGGMLPDGRLNRIGAITRYVNDYDGGECFFVTPISVGETAARLEGYGTSVAPFQLLDDNFKKANGFEADIGIRQVTPAQCPAITFLGLLRAQGSAAPQLDIGQTNLRSGQILTGTIDGYGDHNIELLLVSDDGSVSNLTRLVQTTRDGKTFKVGLQRTGTKVAQPQILMAVTSTRPLDALQFSQPADAAQVFPAALTEAVRAGQTMAVTARYFKLE